MESEQDVREPETSASADVNPGGRKEPELLDDTKLLLEHPILIADYTRLQDKVVRLTAENLYLEATSIRLQKEYQTGKEVARKTQDGLEVQLAALKEKVGALEEVLERLSLEKGALIAQVKAKEGKNQVDQELHSQALNDQREQVNSLLIQRAAMMTAYETVFTTKVMLDNNLANLRNSFEGSGSGSDSASSSLVSLVAPMDGFGHGQLEPVIPVPADYGPSSSTSSPRATAAAAAATVVHKRKCVVLDGNSSEGSKRRRGREADDIETSTVTLEPGEVKDEADVADDDEVDVVEDYEHLPDEDVECHGHGEDEGVDSSKEDFCNAKIVANIIKYLPAKDLPGLRLTCKAWNNEIVKHLQTYTELEFGPDPDLKYLDGIVTKYGTSLIDFVDTMSRSQDTPFRKFHINNLSFSVDSVVNVFEIICGQYITVLKISLEDQNVFTLEDFVDLIFVWAPALRELTVIDNRPVDDLWALGFTSHWDKNQILMLRRLTLATTFSTEVAHRKCFIEFLTQVFKAAINLEYLDIKQGKLPGHSCWNDLNLKVLQAIEKAANCDSLKSLMLYKLSKQDLKILVRLSARKQNGLKLTSFDTSCIARRSTSYNYYSLQFKLNKFLQLQAPFLKNLTVRFDPEERTGSTLKIQLPKLDELRQLTCHYDHDDNYTKEYITFEEQNFPNLKMFELVTLSAYEYLPDMKLLRYLFADVHYGVDVLNLTINVHYSAQRRLAVLAEKFPNIWKLTLDVSHLESLAHVWNKWAQLESLHISCRDVTTRELNGLSRVLTGIPTKKHAALKLKMTSAFASGVNPLDVELVELNKLRTKPALSDLKELRELTLDFSSSNLNSVCIPDLCVYCELVFLRRLRTLRIIPARLVSPICRAALHNVLES